MPTTPSTDLRVVEVEPRHVAIGFGLMERCLALLLLRVDDTELTLRCIEHGPRLASGGLRFLVVGIGLLKPLNRSDPIVAQRPVAIEVRFGTGQFGGRRRDVRGSLFDRRFLQVPFGVEVREGCLLDGDACLRVRELGSVIPIVDLY